MSDNIKHTDMHEPIKAEVNIKEEEIKKLTAYAVELETAIYDKDRELAERDKKIEQLTEKGREYFRKFNSEQLAKRKIQGELGESQEDILVLVRHISRITKYAEKNQRGE